MEGIAIDADSWCWLSALLFLILAGGLTAAQTAAVAVNDYELKKLAESGRKKAVSLLKTVSDAGRFRESLDTVRLFCAFFYMLACAAWLADDIRTVWYGGLTGFGAAVLSRLTVCVLAGLVYLIVAQLFARRLGGAFCNPIALNCAGLLRVCIVIAAPVCAIGRGLSALLCRLFGVTDKSQEERVTEEEIRLLVDEGQEKGVIEKSEQAMIEHVFEFGDRVASEVMTHRTELCAVENTDGIAEALRIAVEGGYSKLPVYEEDLDKIVGVLYVKDLLPYVGHRLPAGLNIASVMRTPYFAPESIRLSELFREMTARQLTMAIIVDEYGGTSGAVTTEDLLETIVGNMRDEYDREDEEFVRHPDGTLEVDGSLSLSDFEERLNRTFPEGDYDTVGGLLLSELGRIPAEGERAEAVISGVAFQVIQMEGRRLARIRVTLPPSETSEDQPEREQEL